MTDKPTHIADPAAHAVRRRLLVQSLAAGSVAAVVGGVAWLIADPLAQNNAANLFRPDGRRRLPPGQRTLVQGPKVEKVDAVEEPRACSGSVRREVLTPEKTAPAPLKQVEVEKPRILQVDATTKDKTRLPPGQKAIDALRPMGGREGDPSRANWRLKVHGEVEKELSLSFDQLLEFQQIEQTCDVHCVTTWSLLGATWMGVRLRDIAEKAKLSKKARHVIFESAHGYTANTTIDEALKENVLLAYQINGEPLARPHGPPVRSLVPDLYFWKSAKWLTGVRFVEKDIRGYWERNGYHNHADPWKEERYSYQE